MTIKTHTLVTKLCAGFFAQNWRVVGPAGTWESAMKPLHKYLDAKIKKEVQAAVAAEREACAKLCDEADKSTHPADLADAIRARGKA